LAPPQTPLGETLAVFKGHTSKGRAGEGARGREGEENGGKGG